MKQKYEDERAALLLPAAVAAAAEVHALRPGQSANAAMQMIAPRMTPSSIQLRYAGPRTLSEVHLTVLSGWHLASSIQEHP